MLKYLIIVLVTIFTIGARADSTSNNGVDISSIITSQIKEAQDKNIVSASKKEKKAAVIESKSSVREEKNVNSSLNYYSPKVMIISFAVLGVFMYVSINRVKQAKEKKLKQNINYIRKEIIIKKDNPKLKSVREKLSDNLELYSLNEEKVKKVAKENKIAQGEMLLAAKIKSYQVTNNLSRL